MVHTFRLSATFVYLCRPWKCNSYHCHWLFYSPHNCCTRHFQVIFTWVDTHLAHILYHLLMHEYTMDNPRTYRFSSIAAMENSCQTHMTSRQQKPLYSQHNFGRCLLPRVTAHHYIYLIHIRSHLLLPSNTVDILHTMHLQLHIRSLRKYTLFSST